MYFPKCRSPKLLELIFAIIPTNVLNIQVVFHILRPKNWFWALKVNAFHASYKWLKENVKKLRVCIPINLGFYLFFIMYVTSTISFIRSSSPGQFGFTRPRGDQPQHAGADLAHVRGGSAADLHADAERLVPALHELLGIHGSAQEPRGSSLWAIDSPLPHT